MKIAFTTLVCSRDFDIFKFNLLTSRLFLNKGFDYSHYIVHDGSLTDDQKDDLKSFPKVKVSDRPVSLNDKLPHPAYTAKLQLFERAFQAYDDDLIILIDCDVFFLKPWDADLLKMVMSDNVVCLRDWGSSIGPDPVRFKKVFGVQEDVSTPNCNTGMVSIPREKFPNIYPVYRRHLLDPFPVLGDQGLIFAAFHGSLEYLDGFKTVVFGAEYHPKIWAHMLEQKGLHLNGMSLRQDGVQLLINHIKKICPTSIPLKRFTPFLTKAFKGTMLEHDMYDHTKQFQAFPSTYQGDWITDALYLHGGSSVTYIFPVQANRFTGKYVCMDTGKADNCGDIRLNDRAFSLNQDIDLELKGALIIEVPYRELAHTAILRPRVNFSL